MKVIAQGPCEVSKEMLLPYVGRTIEFHAHGVYKGSPKTIITDSGDKTINLSEDQKYVLR